MARPPLMPDVGLLVLRLGTGAALAALLLGEASQDRCGWSWSDSLMSRAVRDRRIMSFR